jgi:ubiquinone/menaquinone biosynthesis C-methylase UbiE
MSDSANWREFWERQSSQDVSDYEFDRGTSPRDAEAEELSARELLEFIEPKSGEIIFDAGCGTGVNMFLLHSLVQRVIGMDYSEGAIVRCRRRIQSQNIQNVELHQGSLTALPLPDRSADKILCMSVLQYLDDEDARKAFREFARVLKPDGTVILHVKNRSSLYLSTLRLAKRVKRLLGGKAKLEYVRPFRWYVRELESAGFCLDTYNSFNLLVIEGMPRALVRFLQRMELRHHKDFPLRSGFLRRHGADLKLKAQVMEKCQ